MHLQLVILGLSHVAMWYKAITKILANRLAPVLGLIIDQLQATFVDDRNLNENVHLAHELLRHYNRKRISLRCLLKIELMKAYHFIDWGFLKSVLDGLGFQADLFGG